VFGGFFDETRSHISLTNRHKMRLPWRDGCRHPLPKPTLETSGGRGHRDWNASNKSCRPQP
jgi:hypothetical protein